MKRVYIAGPYSADNVMDVFANMRRGIDLAVEVLKAGYAPFCPWLDHDFALRTDLPIEAFYSYSMAWLEKSDAVLVQTYGAGHSVGTSMELTRARELKIPVFYSLDEMVAKLRGAWGLQ